MNTQPPPDFTKLAAEAMDLWQEHLATLAADPKAKADLAQLLEPQRRVFAEWMKKAQDAAHGTASFATTTNDTSTDTSDRTATFRPSSDDGSLRLAQLALHVAELEKRVAKLEARKPRAARKTPSDSE